jgi:hypothetical protein
MSETLADWRSAALAAAETDRQVRRLYSLAYAVNPLRGMLANPKASPATVAYASTRIRRALSAAARLLAIPGAPNTTKPPTPARSWTQPSAS